MTHLMWLEYIWLEESLAAFQLDYSEQRRLILSGQMVSSTEGALNFWANRLWVLSRYLLTHSLSHTYSDNSLQKPLVSELTGPTRFQELILLNILKMVMNSAKLGLVEVLPTVFLRQEKVESDETYYRDHQTVQTR